MIFDENGKVISAENINKDKTKSEINIKLNNEDISQKVLEDSKNIHNDDKKTNDINIQKSNCDAKYNGKSSTQKSKNKIKISQEQYIVIIAAVITGAATIIAAIIQRTPNAPSGGGTDTAITTTQTEPATINFLETGDFNIISIPQITEIPVPNVIGKTESDARFWLGKRGLSYTIIECETNPNKIDNSLSYSVVSKQFPEPNTYVENNSIVELYMDECVYYIETKDEKMIECSDVLKELSSEYGKLIIHNENNCTGFIYNNFLSENYIGKIEGDHKIIGWIIDMNTGYDTMSLTVSLDLGNGDNTHILNGSAIYNNIGTLNNDINSYIINDEILIQINSDNLPFNLNDVQEIEIKNLWKEI